MASVVARHVLNDADGTQAVTLTATGSNRLILVVASGRGTNPPTLDSLTLSTESATINSGVSVDGGKANSQYLAYFLESQHPGSGSQNFIFSWSLLQNAIAVIYELQDVDQTTPFPTPQSETYTTISTTQSLSLSITGETGELGIDAVSAADGSIIDSSTLTSVSANLGNQQFADANNNIMWTHDDASIASSPETYSSTYNHSSAGANTDSLVHVSLAIQGSATPAAETNLLTLLGVG